MVSRHGGMRGGVSRCTGANKSRGVGSSPYSSLFFSGMYRQYKYERATVDVDIMAVALRVM